MDPGSRTVQGTRPTLTTPQLRWTLVWFPLSVTWLIALAISFLPADFRSDQGVGGTLDRSWYHVVPFAIGALAAIWIRGPILGQPPDRTSDSAEADQDRDRLTSAGVGLAAGVILSLIIVESLAVGRSVDSLWRLGGSIRYSNGSVRGGLAVLASLASAVALLTPAAAVLMQRRQLKPVTAGLVSLLALVAVGRGTRGPVIAALLTTIVVRGIRGKSLRSMMRSGRGVRLALAALMIGLFVLLGVQTLRSGSRNDAFEIAALTRNLDQLTTAEALAENPALMPDSDSSLETSIALLPPRLLFPGKPTGFALDESLDRLYPGRSGATVPLWSAGWFDAGVTGSFLYGVIATMSFLVVARLVLRATNHWLLTALTIAFAASQSYPRLSFLQLWVACGTLALASVLLTLGRRLDVRPVR